MMLQNESQFLFFEIKVRRKMYESADLSVEALLNVYLFLIFLLHNSYFSSILDILC